MSISAISELGAGPSASSTSSGTAQSPAQRISALQAQQAQIDAQIATTKADKKLSCSDIDSKVGSLKTQRAQVDSQLQRVESQQRQVHPPADSVQADSAQPATRAPPAPRLDLASSPGQRSQIHVIA